MSLIFSLLELPNVLSEAPSVETSLQPLDSLKFPTIKELTEEAQRLSLVTAPQPKGLFEGLIQGRAEVLWLDLLEDPERYNEPVLPLVESMLQGRKVSELTAEELALLDEATMVYAQTPPSKKKEASGNTPSRAEAAPVEEEETAEAELPPYWWL